MKKKALSGGAGGGVACAPPPPSLILPCLVDKKCVKNVKCLLFEGLHCNACESFIYVQKIAIFSLKLIWQEIW